MNKYQLLAPIELENGAVAGFDEKPAEIAIKYKNAGCDGLYIIDSSSTDEEHNANISAIIDITNAIDMFIIAGGNIKRMEDVKKYLYAGASMAIFEDVFDENLIDDSAKRFGEEKIGVIENDKVIDYNKDIVGEIVKESFQFDYNQMKRDLKSSGMDVNILDPQLSFDDAKVNDAGLIPVVVQDFKTDKVLMLAYMNEEAFNQTIETGRMTYYSRSRDEIWIKGETSGNFQYVKDLKFDCDFDTLLAKVYQVGVPCHTGAKTCFFNDVIDADYATQNPMKVFEDVYNVILDRKENPKEGSYTNYLFDKGIDKILKKVGEEATEIVIAAKNPDNKEIKYEISDFLYHIMVLMAEKGVTWEEITEELARR